MGTKSIKISDENYKDLCSLAGEVQKDLGEPVSLDKALAFLMHKEKLSELAGSWKMTDQEAENFMKTLRQGWSKWKIKSA